MNMNPVTTRASFSYGVANETWAFLSVRLPATPRCSHPLESKAMLICSFWLFVEIEALKGLPGAPFIAAVTCPAELRGFQHFAR